VGGVRDVLQGVHVEFGALGIVFRGVVVLQCVIDAVGVPPVGVVQQCVLVELLHEVGLAVLVGLERLGLVEAGPSDLHHAGLDEG